VKSIRFSILLLVVWLGLAQPSLGFQLAAQTPICAACGQQIGPGRYMQDQWKACYHLEHAHIKRCVYCARGISEYNTHGGVHYPDGRDVCNICQETAVVDEGTAASLEASTRDRMSAWGLTFAYGDIPVKLVDQATLNRLFGHGTEIGDGKINGLTTKRWTKDGSGKVVAREVSIAILYGLPQEIYSKTIAHELMHSWMFLDHEPEHVPALEEGTCNLASYYMLQESPDPLAGFLREAMFKSSNPTYGMGLRRAIKFVQARQFTGLVKMLRSNRDFPAGF
jgi:hypothetical protein